MAVEEPMAARVFGVGTHALQDSKPHNGTKMNGHSLKKDMALGQEGKKAYGEASKITELALIIVEVLNGNFLHVKSGTSFDLSGMNVAQKKELIEALAKGSFKF